MVRTPQSKFSRSVSQQKRSHLKRWGQRLLLGTGASFLFCTGGHAAERIILRFETTEVVVPIANLSNFVTKGEVESADLQTFFQKNPRVETIVRNVLGREIAISKVTASRFFQSSTGEFVLTQLDKIINTPARSAGLESLRTAVLASYQEDNRFSLLEVLNNYPGQDINLDVSALERVYNDVSAFVERIQPALEAVKGVLQDFICECEKQSASESVPGQANKSNSEMLPPAAGTEVQSQRSQCVKPQASTVPPTP